jgi:glycosyltransferase involved in cell wall biosynthesis
MAAGTPLVATAVGGLPSLLGDDAVLVPPRDPAALAAGIDRLLGDERLRAALADAARERARPHEIGAVAERFGTLYLDLLERKCSRS